MLTDLLAALPALTLAGGLWTLALAVPVRATYTPRAGHPIPERTPCAP